MDVDRHACCCDVDGRAFGSAVQLPALWDALKASAGNSYVLETEGPFILNGTFDTDFALKLHCKDLDIGYKMVRSSPCRLQHRSHRAQRCMHAHRIRPSSDGRTCTPCAAGAQPQDAARAARRHGSHTGHALPRHQCTLLTDESCTGCARGRHGVAQQIYERARARYGDDAPSSMPAKLMQEDCGVQLQAPGFDGFTYPDRTSNWDRPLKGGRWKPRAKL
jgi:hypothetical protein